MGKKDKAAALETAAKDLTTMAVHIDIHLGTNTFDVNGDVPDLQPVVDLFRIWVNAQQGEDSQVPAFDQAVGKIEQSAADLESAVEVHTPVTPST